MLRVPLVPPGVGQAVPGWRVAQVQAWEQRAGPVLVVQAGRARASGSA
ncbi:hypothetical protein EBBID32_44940 [Sphingobium indicum BiD32]|uniref:Uncharacterized protein n=1 Tax=Sphingobium indicum BiD32 TaxID=1301087 RepID=N1MXY7_9SPHN|nr:hypothetical protein EBBID32_44940 [Sphingobium indicum BiD32]